MSKSSYSEGKYVARTHMTCPICAKDTEEALLIHKNLRDISEVDNKSTGFSKPCEECQKGIDMGAIMVIIIDKNLSGAQSDMESWYRCGEIYGLSEDSVRRFLKLSPHLNQVMKSRVMVMDYQDARAVGIPVKYKS